jgi:hypothetical protein
MTSSTPTFGMRVRSLRMGLLALIVGLGSITGCARQVEVLRDRGPQAYYQTGFPYQDTSEVLQRALESVKRIQTTATYRTYIFERDTAPREGEAWTPQVLGRAADTLTVPHDRAASAVVLSRRNRNLALITVDHVLHFPDTIVAFFDDGGGTGAPGAAAGGPRLVESVSFKLRRVNWVLGLPGLDPFEILVRDPQRDLALIGVHYPYEERRWDLPVPVEVPIPVLSLVTGDSGRLSLGSFVYVLGYPHGYPMVTRGIVSAPSDPSVGSFLVDGLWNRGMSGGLILAVRGGTGAMEWVGMARAAAASTEARLVPEPTATTDPRVRRPYDGPIFLEEFRRIEYGITFTVPVTEIRRFLDQHREALDGLGYGVPNR